MRLSSENQFNTRQSIYKSLIQAVKVRIMDAKST
jgi:hypothetical protein